jgi:hypothetical protein
MDYGYEYGQFYSRPFCDKFKPIFLFSCAYHYWVKIKACKYILYKPSMVFQRCQSHMELILLCQASKVIDHRCEDNISLGEIRGDIGVIR